MGSGKRQSVGACGAVALLQAVALLLAVALLQAVAFTQTARAEEAEGAEGTQGKSGSNGQTEFGVGAESMLTSYDFSLRGFDITGISGLALLYEADVLHVAGVLRFLDQDPLSLFGVGARVFVPIRRSARADFSVGGGLGVLKVRVENPIVDAEFTDFHLEGVAQVRLWLRSNVTVSTTFGIGVVAGDNDSTRLRGQLSVGASVGYYFF